MKISLTHIVFQIALLLAMLFTVSPKPLVADGELPAFPGAEGFGAEMP